MEIKKRILALMLAGVMTTSLVGCKKNNKLNLNHYDNYIFTDIEGDKVVKKYNGSNVLISVNKETNEVNEYLYFAGEANTYLYNGLDNAELLNDLGFIVELYDLETGELVYFNSEKNKEYNIDNINISKLLEENNFYDIFDLFNLGVEYKEWYTIEEIRDIAQIIVNRNVKIKKLSSN